MKIYVKLYAQLRKYHPGPNRSQALELELPAGASARAVVEYLQLPSELVRSAFANNTQIALDAALADGDQLSLFSPVVGGATPARA